MLKKVIPVIIPPPSLGESIVPSCAGLFYNARRKTFELYVEDEQGHMFLHGWINADAAGDAFLSKWMNDVNERDPVFAIKIYERMSMDQVERIDCEDCD